MDDGSTRVFGRALGALARLQAALDPEERRWLDEVPLTMALDGLDGIPPGFDFMYTTPEVEAVDAAAGLSGGEEWTGRYWNLVLLRLTARSFLMPRPYRMPDAQHRQLLAELDRIVGECEAGLVRHDPLGDAEFLQNLGLARGAMAPFSIALCLVPAWLPPWVPDTFRTYGDRPWMNIHLSERRASELTNDEAYFEGVKMGVDFFRLNPDYAGVFGIGWLTDPTVGDVSPHLAFHAGRLTELGATVTSLGVTDGSTIHQATSSSRTRRRMYREGQWTPTEQFLFWPAERLLKWAEDAGL